jgi:dolichol-phosphate mannosyltransferase
MAKLVSFVVPVFNEEDNINEFYKHLTTVMAKEPYDYELIFVDDGSRDATPALINALVEKDAHVQGYIFSRNFGHQRALTCGMDAAMGDALITMDGDLQHPPELVPQLLRLWEGGYEIVQTIRKATEDASFFKNLTSSAYYKLINALSDMRITPGGSDFRLLDKKAVAAFRLFRERARFIRGLINNMGFKYTTLEFVAPPRFAGKSKYNLSKMLHFALDGITAFSNVPLRFAFYLGCIFGFGSILLLFHVIYVKYIIEDAVPGWTTLAVSVLFLGGIQLVGIGIVGEYVGRIFEEVKQRPLYIIREHLVKK